METRPVSRILAGLASSGLGYCATSHVNRGFTTRPLIYVRLIARQALMTSGHSAKNRVRMAEGRAM